MKRLLIRNGRVVDPSQGLDQGMDILVEDGIISAVGEKLEAPGRTQVFDAAGLVVAPGFLDLHTHLREPGFEHNETIASGCRAAAAGGFTAVCCMPDTRPVNDDPSVTAFIRERAEQAGMARVYPVGALSQGLAGEAMAEIGEMVAAGAVAVSDDRRPVRNALLFRRALEYARSFDIPVAAHEEDLDLSDGGCMHEGRVSTRIGLAGIPTAAEEVMVARDILLAELTGGRLHLCHLSSATALDLVRTGKRRGLSLSCEVPAPLLRRAGRYLRPRDRGAPGPGPVGARAGHRPDAAGATDVDPAGRDLQPPRRHAARGRRGGPHRARSAGPEERRARALRVQVPQYPLRRSTAQGLARRHHRRRQHRVADQEEDQKLGIRNSEFGIPTRTPPWRGSHSRLPWT